MVQISRLTPPVCIPHAPNTDKPKHTCKNCRFIHEILNITSAVARSMGNFLRSRVKYDLTCVVWIWHIRVWQPQAPS